MLCRKLPEGFLNGMRAQNERNEVFVHVYLAQIGHSQV